MPCLLKWTTLQTQGWKIKIKCVLFVVDSHFSSTRYMETCHDCPNVYPWLGDSTGSGIPGRDNYIFNGKGAAKESETEEDI